MTRARCIVRLLRPYRGLLSVAFAAMLVAGVADLLDPWPLKIVFDSVIGNAGPPTWLTWTASAERLHVLNTAAGALVVIAILGGAGSYWESYLSTTVGQRVMHDLRRMLYHHMQRLSLSYYDHQRTGDLVVRLTSDIDAAQDFISSVLLGMVLDVLTLIGMLAVMLYLDWRFTLIALTTAPILFVMVYRLTRRIKRTARELRERESDLASIVQESVSSVRLMQAFSAEEYEENRLEQQSLASVDTALRARRVKARLSPLTDTVVVAGTALVLIVGVRLVLAGTLTAGAFLIFLVYLGRMYKPMKDLSKMTDSLSKSMAAFDRIEEVLRLESRIADRATARCIDRVRGRIEFLHVSFGYSQDRAVLDDVSFVIEPGQAVAIVGPTGSGKSTLLGLIARFYDPWSGEIRIDGRALAEHTLKSLRDQLGFVLQESVLFRAPVWQNIAYGSPNATRSDIITAARIAHADEFISAMSDGYDTVIGERGGTLSGGQRQRIAIARALVRNAPILLLDEPSASLDSESEELIFDGLAELLKGRTSITIAHRLATIRRADVIFVLDRGRIVERGAHDELLAAGGLYSRVHAIQFEAA